MRFRFERPCQRRTSQGCCTPLGPVCSGRAAPPAQRWTFVRWELLTHRGKSSEMAEGRHGRRMGLAVNRSERRSECGHDTESVCAGPCRPGVVPPPSSAALGAQRHHRSRQSTRQRVPRCSVAAALHESHQTAKTLRA